MRYPILFLLTLLGIGLLFLPNTNAVTQLRFFDQSSATVNGLLAYNLDTTLTGSFLTSNGATATSASTCHFGIVVWKRSSGGVETLIDGSTSNPDAQVTTTSTTEQFKFNYATIPQTTLATTDSIVVRVYSKNDGIGGGSWVDTYDSQTERLGATILNARSWLVHYEVWRGFSRPTYYCKFDVVSAVNPSDIDNFEYGDQTQIASEVLKIADSVIVNGKLILADSFKIGEALSLKVKALFSEGLKIADSITANGKLVLSEIAKIRDNLLTKFRGLWNIFPYDYRPAAFLLVFIGTIIFLLFFLRRRD